MPNSSEIYQALLEHFPFDTPRAEQLQAFEELSPWIERLFVQEFQKPIFFGIDAPTGVGKSPLGVSVALAIKALHTAEHGDSLDSETGKETAQIWVVTQNKLLQDQYTRDFSDELFDLRGLDNYNCRHEATTCGKAACGRMSAKPAQRAQMEEYRDNGLPLPKELRPPAFCTFDCEYDREKRKSMQAPILSLNVAKALTMLKGGGWAQPLMVIFDEGHEIESALDSEAAFSLRPEELERVGLSFYRYFSNLEDLDEIKAGLNSLAADCTPLLEAEESASIATRDVKRMKKFTSIITKVGETIGNIEAGIEYVSCQTDRLEMKPLQVGKVFEKFFKFPTLFMSATLLSKTGFESLTGIQENALDWFACPSPFPIANRPIKMFWRPGAVPLNYNNMSEELPNLVKRVGTVLATHPNDRGIIHAHTYKIAERVYNDLYPEYGNRLLFPKTAADQKDALERHARTPNSVLISPSMTQGVDLAGDLCRFSVMCKVPWLPTNDPVVKARMESNRSWYSFKTAMTVVQAPGRGVRSSTDFATTYLIDPGFTRFFNIAKGLLPQWFLDSLIHKPCGYY